VIQLWWSFLHVLGWSTYIGGALVMELIWRPAQEEMPQSQIAVACQWMGRRYRWIAAMALALTGISGSAMALSSDEELTLSNPWGRTLVASVVVWLALVVTLAMITFYGHPSLHTRMRADLSEDERRAARERVRRAIHRMDILLRVDLFLALLAGLLGASLHVGGIL
jgi:uncharacterized membrane protein